MNNSLDEIKKIKEFLSNCIVHIDWELAKGDMANPIDIDNSCNSAIRNCLLIKDQVTNILKNIYLTNEP